MKPIRHKFTDSTGMNCQIVSCGWLASSSCSALVPMNAISAVCDTRRAPKRSTMRELVKLAMLIITAVPPNKSGNHEPAPKCSATSCCDELM